MKRKTTLTILAMTIIILSTACGLLGSSEEEPQFEPIDFSSQDNPTEMAPTPVETEVAGRDNTYTTGNPHPGNATQEIPTAEHEGTPGICGRTPEVQNAIIEHLGIPYCAEIEDPELTRIRSLKIQTSQLTPEDLLALPNMLELELTGVHFTLEPETFRDLANLKALRINSTAPRIGLSPMLSPETFTGLTQLESLEIQVEGGWTPIHLTQETTKGLETLRILNLENVQTISQNAMDGLQNSIPCG